MSDPDRKVIAAYGAANARFGGLSNRWTFYIDKEGIIIYIDKQVKVTSAGEDMVKRLGELGYPQKED